MTLSPQYPPSQLNQFLILTLPPLAPALVGAAPAPPAPTARDGAAPVPPAPTARDGAAPVPPAPTAGDGAAPHLTLCPTAETPTLLPQSPVSTPFLLLIPATHPMMSTSTPEKLQEPFMTLSPEKFQLSPGATPKSQ